MHNKHVSSSLGTHKNDQDINLNYNGQKSLEFVYATGKTGVINASISKYVHKQFKIPT